MGKKQDEKIPIKKQIKILRSDLSYIGMFLGAAITSGASGGIAASINLVSSVFFGDEVKKNLPFVY